MKIDVKNTSPRVGYEQAMVAPIPDSIASLAKAIARPPPAMARPLRASPSLAVCKALSQKSFSASGTNGRGRPDTLPVV